MVRDNWVPTASVASLPKFYGSYLFLGAAYAGALIAILSAGVIAVHFQRRWQGLSHTMTSWVDGALILTFLALPIVALIVTRIMRAGMLDRYVLATIFGICLATACLLSRARLSTVLLFALFLGSSVGLHENLLLARFPRDKSTVRHYERRTIHRNSRSSRASRCRI